MTTLVRWTPFRELDLVDRHMRRVFDGLGFGPTTLPAVDVYETKGEFVVELEVPGFKEPELAIEVTDHVLTVKGERTETKQELERTFQLRERLERHFERRFELPPEADPAQMTAVFTNGVLEIHTPKVASVAPKKIQIGT